MYSSSDLERFYFQYQTEGLPKGVSIQNFCNQNKIPYNIFKDTRKQVVSVKVDGHPSDATSATESSAMAHADQPLKSQVRIMVELHLSNGLHISQKNLNYQDLVILVKKLEVLC